ncbi:hypothetical protein CMUS01_07945 [Colletotrichum musicola]|uniref:Uncharacterized protein n=1 Tax=Colletotrichum musicola TaxID=2175873 RepID=A0A8H6KEF6_9PEZI|nr:hypothetical protein CMUS01_07945 [Colletotrichum musicola]
MPLPHSVSPVFWRAELRQAQPAVAVIAPTSPTRSHFPRKIEDEEAGDAILIFVESPDVPHPRPELRTLHCSGILVRSSNAPSSPRLQSFAFYHHCHYHHHHHHCEARVSPDPGSAPYLTPASVFSLTPLPVVTTAIKLFVSSPMLLLERSPPLSLASLSDIPVRGSSLAGAPAPVSVLAVAQDNSQRPDCSMTPPPPGHDASSAFVRLGGLFLVRFASSSEQWQDSAYYNVGY